MTDARCLVVVGAQWGDEGKGKVVDVLAERARVIARYQGGPNAGHTVHVGEHAFVLHQIPSGVLHPGTLCLLGNGVVLDPLQFFAELDELVARGIDVAGRVWVSWRAHLLLPYHRCLDRALEERRGAARLGTTGRGIGPAYEDKVARHGLRVVDLADADRARDRLREGTERANVRLRALGAAPLDPERVLAEVLGVRERLLALGADTGRLVSEALDRGERVLLEGAQGALLDLDHGTYPYVTSSTTTAGGAAVGVGIGPTRIDAVLGVVKAYTTRVGAGPFPTELPSPEQERLRELGGEFGATTGRPRRCGWFDAVVVRYAARVNGLSGLAVTKLDVLDTLPEVRLAVAYEIDGARVDEVPADLDALGRARPIYETLPGWQRPTAQARRWEELPTAAQAYLRRLEELTGVPLWYVSVGSRRDQMLALPAAP